jgi:hypothetical protein
MMACRISGRSEAEGLFFVRYLYILLVLCALFKENRYTLQLDYPYVKEHGRRADFFLGAPREAVT